MLHYTALYCIYYIHTAKKNTHGYLNDQISCSEGAILACLENNIIVIYISLFTGTVPWEETASHLPLSASFSVHQICWQQIPVYQRLQKYRLLNAYIKDKEKTEDCELGEMSTWKKNYRIISATVPDFVDHIHALCTVHSYHFSKIVVEMSYLFTLASNKPCAQSELV